METTEGGEGEDGDGLRVEVHAAIPLTIEFLPNAVVCNTQENAEVKRRDSRETRS